MRLLVVMSHYPYPPRTGSAILAYNNIKELSKNHSIHLICLDNLKEKLNLAEFIDQVDFVSRKTKSRFITLLHYFIGMLKGVPVSVTALMSHEMNQRIRILSESGKFDAVILYQMSSIQYCPASCYKRALVNIEDPESIKLYRMAELNVWTFWQKIKLIIFARLTARYENLFLPKMAKVILLSEADLRDMHKQGGYDNLGYVPYGICKRNQEEIRSYEDRTNGMIVFTGNMFHPPNVDGALFFLRKIFPLILKEYSLATLWVVGDKPDARIRKAAAKFGDRVILTGRVDDMSVYLQRAKVSVCPVRLKIGVQTKILEALSWGTPIVTTHVGSSGIGGGSGRGMWIEDEPVHFASRVVSLLNGDDWRQLSDEGRKFVAEHFSWARSSFELEQHIKHIRTATQ